MRIGAILLACLWCSYANAGSAPRVGQIPHLPAYADKVEQTATRAPGISALLAKATIEDLTYAAATAPEGRAKCYQAWAQALATSQASAMAVRGMKLVDAKHGAVSNFEADVQIIEAIAPCRPVAKALRMSLTQFLTAATRGVK